MISPFLESPMETLVIWYLLDFNFWKIKAFWFTNKQQVYSSSSSVSDIIKTSSSSSSCAQYWLNKHPTQTKPMLRMVSFGTANRRVYGRGKSAPAESFLSNRVVWWNLRARTELIDVILTLYKRNSIKIEHLVKHRTSGHFKLWILFDVI